MTRVKRGFKLRRRHKKVLKLAKGYRGSRRLLYRSAIRVVRKALTYAYRDRRVKKREMRSLWIQRINAGSRLHGLPYSKLFAGLKKANIQIDRKQLSEMAISDEKAFGMIVAKAKAALG